MAYARCEIDRKQPLLRKMCRPSGRKDKIAAGRDERNFGVGRRRGVFRAYAEIRLEDGENRACADLARLRLRRRNGQQVSGRGRHIRSRRKRREAARGSGRRRRAFSARRGIAFRAGHRRVAEFQTENVLRNDVRDRDYETRQRDLDGVLSRERPVGRTASVHGRFRAQGYAGRARRAA